MAADAEKVTEVDRVLERLTRFHPEACQLVLRLISAIDKQRRVEEAAKDYPSYEIAGFELSDLYAVFQSTLQNLATSDATSIEFDHAGGVINQFLRSLAAKGYVLESDEFTPEAHADLVGKSVEIGYDLKLRPGSVDSPRASGRIYTVSDVQGDVISVTSVDDQTFDVSPMQVERMFVPD